MSDQALMNAAPCEGVVVGSCVMLAENVIVYAGPIKGAPLTDGLTVLLNGADFEKFKAHVERGRH
jgi:hypothetical protein